MAEQLLGAVDVENDARIDLAVDLEGDLARQVGLDDAGDDITTRPLRRQDDVHADGTRLLCQPLDQVFDFVRRNVHQVSELVDDDHDVAQENAIRVRFAAHALGKFLLAEAVVVLDVVDAGDGQHRVAVLHLVDRPLQDARRLLHVGDDLAAKVRHLLICLQFDHLRVNQDQLDLLRRARHQDREQDRIDTDRLTGSGRAGNQQVRHAREVFDDRIAFETLAEEKRDRAVFSAPKHVEQVAHVDMLTCRVGHFDAHRVFTWNRRNHAHRDGL